MIVYEKMQVVFEYQNEVWVDGMVDGIELEIIVDVVIVLVMCEMVCIYGEVGVEVMLENLCEWMFVGEFLFECIL